MQTMNFLSRMGEWFKAGANRGELKTDLDVEDRGMLTGDEVSENRGGSLITRWQDRSQSVQRLEEGYQQLSELVESIQKHLQAQDERSRGITTALTNLAEPVSQIPESMRRQQEQLAAIVDQLESANARSGRLEATISDWPKLADAQRETLLAVREEMDAATASQGRIAESMDGFREAVTSLTHASNTSVETLKNMQASTSAKDDRLMNLLAEQNRKFTNLFVVAIVLSAVLAIATATSLFIR